MTTHQSVAQAALFVLLACSCTPSNPSSPSSSSSSSSPPSEWPTPDGFKSETIPFPLDFAPEIRHVGTEQLRFAPGFFNTNAAGYFTYAFAWRIERAPTWPEVATDLEQYFRGLMRSVAESKKKKLDVNGISATLTPGPKPHESEGIVTTPDAFGDGRTLTLHVRAFETLCPKGALLTFAMSPAPFNTDLSLRVVDLAKSARCDLIVMSAPTH
jgi:hypothetical protein